MDSTIPAWIAAACSLAGAFGIAWWNGRFTGSVNSRLQAIEKAVNGQIKDQFDSATKHRDKLKQATDGVATALAERASTCTEHTVRLETVEKSVDVIFSRLDRQQHIEG